MVLTDQIRVRIIELNDDINVLGNKYADLIGRGEDIKWVNRRLYYAKEALSENIMLLKELEVAPFIQQNMQ